MGGYLIILGVIILDILAIVDVIRSRVNYSWAYIILIVALPFIGFSIWYLYKTIFRIKLPKKEATLSSDLKGNKSGSLRLNLNKVDDD